MLNTFTNSKLYKLLHLLFNIGLWVAIVLCLINIVIMVFGKQMFMSSGLSFDGFYIDSSLLAESQGLKWLLVGVALVTYTAGIICIWMLRNMINSLKSNSPFTLHNVKRIRVIGWILLVETYLKQLLNFLYINKINSLIINISTSPTLHARFNLLPDSIALVLCILILAEIFKYGCVLQSEHDTTV